MRKFIALCTLFLLSISIVYNLYGWESLRNDPMRRIYDSREIWSASTNQHPDSLATSRHPDSLLVLTASTSKDSTILYRGGITNNVFLYSPNDSVFCTFEVFTGEYHNGKVWMFEKLYSCEISTGPLFFSSPDLTVNPGQQFYIRLSGATGCGHVNVQGYLTRQIQ